MAAAAAAVVGGASAHVAHRQAHNDLFLAKRQNGTDLEICVPTCTTIYTTVTGDIICMSGY